MKNSTASWILRNGTEDIDCVSFPFAYRTAFNLVRKTIEARTDAASVIKSLTIFGPRNPRGERKSYSYAAATSLAREQGLLTPEGTINNREFKKK